MLAPIDAAWMVLKASNNETRSHFGGVESFPKRWQNLQEHGDVRGAEPEGGWSGKQLEIGQDEQPDVEGDEEQTARDKGHTQDVADVSPEADAPVDAAAALEEVMRRKKLEGA